MKFKKGQKWLTRDNTIVTILGVVRDEGGFPVVGRFEGTRERFNFSENGKYAFDGSESPGDIMTLVHDPVHYKSPTPASMQEILEYLDEMFIVYGTIEIPDDVRENTATLFEAVQYMVDQENVGEYYEDD